MEDENLISEDNILLNIKLNSKEEVINKLSDLLVNSKAVSEKEGFIKDIYERESRGFTYAGDYLAIPHGWSEYVIKPAMAIAKTDTAFAWDKAGNLVKLVIMFVIPENIEMENNLKKIGKIFSALGDTKLVKKLLKLNTKKEIIEFICSITKTN